MENSQTLYNHCKWTPDNNWYQHLSDVNCVVDGKIYQLHSSILATKTELYNKENMICDNETMNEDNTVFDKENFLRNKMRKQNNAVIKIIEKLDVYSKDFDVAVMFLYNDICRLNQNNCLPVLRIAHTLRMTDLFTLAERMYVSGQLEVLTDDDALVSLDVNNESYSGNGTIVQLNNRGDGHTSEHGKIDYNRKIDGKEFGVELYLGRNSELLKKKDDAFSKYQVKLALKAIHLRTDLGITPENCTLAYIYGREQQIRNLTLIAGNYLMRNVIEASNYPGYQKLSAKQLKNILSHPCLHVIDEYQVFELAMIWLNGQDESCFLKKNGDIVSRLLKCVRFHRLSTVIRIYMNETMRKCEVGRIFLEKMWLKLKANQYTRKHDSGAIEMLKTRLVPIHPRLPANLVVTIGGWHSNKPLNKMEIYDSAADHWFTYEFTPDLPIRAYHGMTNAPGRCIYIIGGLDENNIQLSSVVQVDVEKLKWKYVSNMSNARCFPSTCWCLGKLYVMGGINKNLRMKSAEMYDDTRDVWTKIPNMLEIRSDAACGSVNGRVYIAGGFNGSICLNSMEYYDPVVNQWTMVTSMAENRSGISMVVHQHYIYIIGGYNGINRLSNCNRFDCKTSAWTSLAKMNVARSNMATFQLQGYLFTVGGYDGSGTTDIVERYNPIDNEWEVMSSILLAKSAVKAVVINNVQDMVRLTYRGNAKDLQVQRDEFINKISRNNLLDLYTTHDDISMDNHEYYGICFSDDLHNERGQIDNQQDQQVAEDNDYGLMQLRINPLEVQRNRPNAAIIEEEGEGRVMGIIAEDRHLQVNQENMVERLRQAFRLNEDMDNNIEVLERQVNAAARVLHERVIDYRRQNQHLPVEERQEMPANIRQLRDMLFRTNPMRRGIGENGAGEGSL